MANYTWVGLSQGKPWWKFVAILTCKSFVKPEYRGERLTEPSSSWFLPKFPSGLLKLLSFLKIFIYFFFFSISQLCLVKLMIRSIGNVTFLTYFQTLNGHNLLSLPYFVSNLNMNKNFRMNKFSVGHVSGKQDWRCGVNQTLS